MNNIREHHEPSRELDPITALAKALNQERITLKAECFFCGEEIDILFSCDKFVGISNVNGGCVDIFNDGEIRIYHRGCW